MHGPVSLYLCWTQKGRPSLKEYSGRCSRLSFCRQGRAPKLLEFFAVQLIDSDVRCSCRWNQDITAPPPPPHANKRQTTEPSMPRRYLTKKNRAEEDSEASHRLLGAAGGLSATGAGASDARPPRRRASASPPADATLTRPAAVRKTVGMAAATSILRGTGGVKVLAGGVCALILVATG